MVEKNKLTSREKEKKLIEKIEKAKQELQKLQHKRKLEIGALAIKHKLDEIGLKKLDTAFAKLASDLSNES